MKEQSEKAVKKGSRSYFYAVLGCIAVLLAAAIVITAVALSGRKDDIAGIPDPGEIVTPGGDEPAAPSEPDKPDEPAPVTKPDGFYAPVADMNSLNLYGFYYNKTLNCYHLHDGIDFAATAGDKYCNHHSNQMQRYLHSHRPDSGPYTLPLKLTDHLGNIHK